MNRYLELAPPKTRLDGGKIGMSHVPHNCFSESEVDVLEYNLLSVVDGLISYELICSIVAPTGGFKKYMLLKFCVSLYFRVKVWIIVENLTSCVPYYFHSYNSKSYTFSMKKHRLHCVCDVMTYHLAAIPHG
ncbi:hypothetical protein D1007_34432 [Hordeum vulgare]|nr:hypothetical protein D1007_34432 [Hordeum vulgare]